MLKKLAERLCLPPEDLEALNEKIVREKKGLGQQTKNAKTKAQLRNDQYFLVADWRYYSILCLAETAEFKENHEWIAKRLGTTTPKIKEAMERLIRLGYLTYGEKGKLFYQDVELSTEEDTPNTSLKKRHSDNLDAARESIYRDDVMVRDMSFMTLAIDPAKLPEIKKMIRGFQDELADFIAEGDKKEVYEICTQVFPRTNVNKEQIYENFQ